MEAENCEEETKQQVLFFSFFLQHCEEIYEEMTVEAEICEEETKQLVLGFLFLVLTGCVVFSRVSWA